MKGDPRPAILLFTADPELTALAEELEAVGFVVYRVRELASAEQVLDQERDHLVAILDTDQPPGFSFAAAYQLLHEPAPVPTLTLLRGDTQELLPAMRDAHPLEQYTYLPAPIEALVLQVQALVLQAGYGQRERKLASIPTATVRFHQGQVVVLFGPKGGVGRSTLAANLAVGLAHFYEKDVALVDADLWFGDQRVLLDLHAEKSFASLVEHADTLELAVLRDVLVEHSSGVRVLLAPPSPAVVETIPPSLPARVIASYRTLFDFVIVDTHTSLEEHVLQILDGADRILLVTTPEIAAIRGTTEVLRLAPELGWYDKIDVILNRANSGVRWEQLEATLGLKIAQRIVSAGPALVEAANRGQPAILNDAAGKEQITRDLGCLAARVAGEPAPSWSAKGSLTMGGHWWSR